LSRIINYENAGKDRTRLSKTIVLALRELLRQREPNATTKDLVAYMVLALDAISATVDLSVAAWEKRGYWIKADRFRLDWDWTGQLGIQLRAALMTEDWGEVARLTAKIGQKLGKVKIAEKNRLGQPWVGAWESLIKSINQK
jgi:hypothetical protein